MKLTKSNIETKVKAPTDKDQVFYRDDKLKGFALRVTASGTISFVVEKVMNDRVKRITLGKYSDAQPAEKARKMTQALIGRITDGIDPIAEKKSKRMHQTTLREVMTDYLYTRKGLKPKTIYDYQRVVNIAFATLFQSLKICKTKDDGVVKYAMNRSMSPAMIAEYETKLINKSLLQKKLRELGDLAFETADMEL